MAGQLFLSDLQTGKHETIGQDIEKYLSTLLCNKDVADKEEKSKYGLYSVKFLHTSVSQASTSSYPTSLLLAVHNCYLGYKIARDDVQLNEPLTVLKLLYHLLTKFPQKGYPDIHLSIAEHLRDELSYIRETQTSNVDAIIHNVYSYLWNVAAKLEQDQSNSSPDIVLKLRHAALKTLLFGPSSVSVFVEKYLVAFNRYDKVTVQYREKGMHTEAELFVDLTLDLVSNLIRRGAHVLQTDTEAGSLLSVYFGLLKYILHRSLQTKISDCQTVLGETVQKAYSQRLDVFSVVQNLFNVVDLLFKSSSEKCEKRKGYPLSNIVEVLCRDVVNSFISWPQICKTFIHDMITLLLKHVEGSAPSHSSEINQDILKIGSVTTSLTPVDDKQLLASVEHLQLCLRILFKCLKDTQDRNTFVYFEETVTELSSRYNVILESDMLDLPAKKLSQERHYCGYLMSKLGHLYSTKGDNSSACKLYTISCHQLTKWVESDPSLGQQRLQEVSLWLVYECLSECQKKNQDLLSAMETIQQCLLIDSSHVSSAVKLWVRTKKEAMKLGTSDIKQMVLGEKLLRRCPNTKLDITHLLNLELQAFKNNRHSYNEVEMAILKVILDVSTISTVKARALLDISQLIWIKGITEDKSSLDYVEEAEAVLSQSTDALTNVLLAEVYLWSYILQHETQCHQILHLSHNAQPLPEAANTTDASTGVDSEDDTNARTSHKLTSPAMYTLVMEAVAMEKLEKAIALWEMILTDGLDNRADPSILLTTFMLCSSILRLSRKMQKELRVLNLAQQLVDQHPSLDRSALDIRMMEAQILVGQAEGTGHSLLKDTDQLSNLQGTQRDSSVNAMLVNVRQAFYNNQLGKGMTEVTSVISFLESHGCKTRSVCSAEGTAKRLMSMILSLSNGSRQHRNLYPLDLALDAIRMHTGVIQLILGKQFLSFTSEDSLGGNSVEKWSAAEDLVESLLHLGRLYSLAGQDREARCFLREGWQLSHHLCIPYWTLQFLIELAKIHIVSGNIEESTNTILDCCHVLDSCTLERSAATSSQVKTPVPSKKVNTNSVRRKLEEKFGFDESEEDMAQDLSYQLVLPKCYQHVKDKNYCNVCQDPWVSYCVLCVGLAVVRCQFAWEKGSLDTLKNIQNISESRIRMTNEVLSSNSRIEKKKQKKKLTKDDDKSKVITAEVDKLSLKELYLDTVSTQAQILSDSGDMLQCADIATVGLTMCETIPGGSVHVEQLESNLRLYQVLSQCDSLFDCQLGASQFVTTKESSVTDLSDVVDPFDNDNNITQVTASLSKIKINDCPIVCPHATSNMETEDVDQNSQKIDKDNDSIVNQKTGQDKKNTGRKTANKKEKLLQKESVCNTPNRDPSQLDKTDLCQTPVGQQFVFTDTKESVAMPLKTPRSVCSRKAKLDQLLEDDSDDDVNVKSRRGKTTGRKNTKKPARNISNNRDVMKTPKFSLLKEISTSSSENDPIRKGRSRIPCRVNTSKLTDQTGNPKKTSRVEKMESQNGQTTKLTNSKFQSGNKFIRRGNTEKESKDVSSNNGADLELKHKNEVQGIKPSSDVYSFDVSDEDEEWATKTKKKTTGKRKTSATVNSTASLKSRTRTVRNSQTKRQEKVRGNTEENKEKVFSLTKCLDLPDIVLEEQLSPKVESDIKEDVVFGNVPSPPVYDDGDEASTPDLDLASEELLDLDESIELPRGDEKGKRKATTSRRRKKEESSVSDTGSTSGETTEVLRSTQLLNTKIPQMTGFYEPVVKSSSAPIVHEKNEAELDDAISDTLEKAFQQVHHMPSPSLYSRICHMKCLQHIKLSPLKAAFYLCEALAVTFRHQALVNSGKKIRKIKRNQTVEQMEEPEEQTDTGNQSFTEEEHSDAKTPKPKQTGKKQRKNLKQMQGQQTGDQNTAHSNREEDSEIDRLRVEQEGLQFMKSEQDLKEMMEGLPDGMVVCHLSVVNHPIHHSQLLVSRLEKQAEPVVISLSGISSLLGQQILPEFTAVMEEGRQSLKLTKKAEWWRVRRGLDDRLQTVLTSMEDHWLGHWKALLLGSVCLSDQDRDILTTLTDAIHTDIQHRTGTEVSKDKLRVLLQAGDYLSDVHLTNAISELIRCRSDSPIITGLVSSIRSRCIDAGIPCEDARPAHVILVLDKTIQHLPWESIPILRRNAVTRIPSFYHMYVQLSHLRRDKNSIYRNGIDSRQTSYFLDPDGNLPFTREAFEAWFQKEPGWKGLVGERPSADQFKEALTKRDLVIYCGHGSGSRYFHGDDLQQVNCRATTILMGCSSGRLQVKGQLEASGIMLNYFLSGCPCIVSNLWDVTDRDIDRFLESLLSTWLAAEKPCSLLDLIPAARDVCQLPYLIGSAPVVYGFPVFMKS